MPLYEYECSAHGRFERLRPMSEYSKPSDCPECGKKSSKIMSNYSFEMAERFRVIDGSGNIIHEKQVLNNTPPWQETKPEEHSGVPKPLISRSGGVYYPRKLRGM